MIWINLRSTRKPVRQTTVRDERLVCSASKYEHIIPLHRDFHWLRVPERIEFKLSVLVFRCLHGTAPPYLANELRHVADLDSKKRGCDLRQRLPLSHHLRVVRRLQIAHSSSLHRAPGSRLCHPASLRLRQSAPSSIFCHVITLIFPHQILFCILTLKSVLEVIFTQRHSNNIHLIIIIIISS